MATREEIESMFTETPDITKSLLGGGTDWGKFLDTVGPTAFAGILQGTGMLSGSQQKSGYQGGIPSLTATRQQLPIDYNAARRPGSGGVIGIDFGLVIPDENNAPRRPGSGGRRYFTDMVYAPKAAAPVAPQAPVVPVTQPATQETPVNDVGGAAQGGMIGYAQGGIANLGYYLGGATDGMADKIPAKIDEKQQAKLSHGEFIIPSDVVSALGSGNSSAGAKVLYDMMDRVRQHAHGTKKQIKPANPKKTLPA